MLHFAQLLRLQSSAEAAVNVVSANKDDANDTAAAFTLRVKQGIQSERSFSRRGVFLPRKYSGCVTEDGQAFVISAAQFVLGPEAAGVVRRPMRLRPLNACWLPVALVVDRMILSGNSPAPRLRGAGID